MTTDNKDLLNELIGNPTTHPIKVYQSEDDNGDAELKAIENDDYQQKYREEAAKRDNDWRNFFYEKFRYLFMLMCFLFACMVIVLVAHWIFPKSWLWLDDAQLSDIKNIVFTVFASSAVGGWMKKIE